MPFRVIKDFKDLQDDNHVYRVGETYPRKGRAKKERAEHLATDQNAHGVPLIEETKSKDDKDDQNEEVKDDE